MTDSYERALVEDRDGNPRIAAKYYALTSFEKFVESNYELGRDLRIGLTHMLESISADVRAENHDRAQTHFWMIEPLLQRINENDGELLVQGLASEWLGDAYLMLGDNEAVEHYERALDTFQNLSLEDRLFWGAEPEFDNAYGAMKEYLAVYGIEYPNEYTMKFEDRVRAKIDASTTILGKE